MTVMDLDPLLAGLDPAFDCHRPRDVWKKLPWRHSAAGVSETFLRKEWRRMEREFTTIDCRPGCIVCGPEHAAPLCERKRDALIAQQRQQFTAEPLPVPS